MADRNVREPEQALAQRLGRLEERQRAMALHTWSGAVRTEMSARDYIDADAQWTTVVSVTATAGRWIVIGHSQVYIPSTTAYYDIWMKAQVTDPTSGEDIAAENVNLPWKRFLQNPYIGMVIIGPAVYGHFVTDDVVTVSLAVQNLASDDYQAIQSCLILLPV